MFSLFCFSHHGIERNVISSVTCLACNALESQAELELELFTASVGTKETQRSHEFSEQKNKKIDVAALHSQFRCENQGPLLSLSWLRLTLAAFQTIWKFCDNNIICPTSSGAASRISEVLQTIRVTGRTGTGGTRMSTPDADRPAARAKRSLVKQTSTEPFRTAALILYLKASVKWSREPGPPSLPLRESFQPVALEGSGQLQSGGSGGPECPEWIRVQLHGGFRWESMRRVTPSEHEEARRSFLLRRRKRKLSGR